MNIGDQKGFEDAVITVGSEKTEDAGVTGLSTHVEDFLRVAWDGYGYTPVDVVEVEVAAADDD